MSDKLRRVYLIVFGFAGLFQLFCSFLNYKFPGIASPYLGFAAFVVWSVSIIMGIILIILEAKRDVSKFYGRLAGLFLFGVILLAGIMLFSLATKAAKPDSTGRLIDPTRESVRVCVTDDAATVTNLTTGSMQNLSAQENENVYIADNLNGRKPFELKIGKDQAVLAVIGFQVETTNSLNYTIYAITADGRPTYFELNQCFVAGQ